MKHALAQAPRLRIRLALFNTSKGGHPTSHRQRASSIRCARIALLLPSNGEKVAEGPMRGGHAHDFDSRFPIRRANSPLPCERQRPKAAGSLWCSTSKSAVLNTPRA